MSKSRKVRAKDIRRAQYELPGFAAGTCVARLDLALELIGSYRQRYGTNVLVDAIEEHLRETRQDISTWMHYARYVTDYDAAHEAVREECDG